MIDTSLPTMDALAADVPGNAPSASSSIQFPLNVSTLRFVESRAKEICALNAELAVRHKNTLAMQRLPRHMRRRATSHNPKRLPRRLRNLFEIQSRDNPPSQKKRPSRKYRRRKRNLVDEYNRRQESGKPRWLETHLWHAKRFHMRKIWNWVLPWTDNQKSHRGCYRSSQQYCIAYDTSYLSCVELVGPEEVLRKGLSLLCHPDSRITFAQADALKGIRTVMVTVVDFQRRNLLGEVEAMWMPADRGAESRKMWIWVHPCLYDRFVRELKLALDLNEQSSAEVVPSEAPMDVDDVDGKKGATVENGANDLNGYSDVVCPVVAAFEESPGVQETQPPKLRSLEVPSTSESEHPAPPPTPFTMRSKLEQRKLLPRPFPSTNCPAFQRGSVKLTVLKESLVRIRVMGPQSSRVLSSIFQPSSDETVASEVGNWKGLSSDASGEGFAPRSIIGLTVQDPRWKLPNKKQRLRPTTASNDEICRPTSEAFSPCSSLWVPEIRDQAALNKMSDAEINSIRRERNRCPSGRSEEKGESTDAPRIQTIPLILIRVAGDGEAYCPSGGWDVILPLGWGMPLWMNLVYRGVRIGGIKDLTSNGDGPFSFPCGWPDTSAGREWETGISEENRKSDLKRPPSKRARFLDLGLREADPFTFPYEALLRSWGEETDTKVSIHPVGGPRTNLVWTRLVFLGKGCAYDGDAEVKSEDGSKVLGYTRIGGSWFGIGGKRTAYALIVKLPFVEGHLRSGSNVLVRSLVSDTPRRAQLQVVGDDL